MIRFGLVCAALAAFSASPVAAVECRDDLALFRFPGGQAQFTIELADDPQERQQGLMHRASLPASVGMLFIYERPQTASFWMRNTLIPLDMIFIDPTGTVTKVHANAVPLDETPIPGGDGVLMVLEINGGLARRIGIVPGAELAHPRLAQGTAVFPCQ
ncbi:DUF192 domain-containing protein [Phaeovulum sp.]|uniref:DUF192 domain-containing protein n=1 Tax=Phaeovulum sp. TaxID=2934796 RepID=UPI003521101A